jgi:type I restriction enzyme, R subunit
MPFGFSESHVEEATLSWFQALGYTILSGPQIAPGELFCERDTYEQVILPKRLKNALNRINPDIPAEAIEEAFRKITRAESPSLITNNHTFHQWLVNGVEVEYKRPDGSIAGDKVKLIDFDNLDNNEWLAVNQYTIVEARHTRRPDVIIFVNGLPLAVIELKNPADVNATIWTAFNQLQTYKNEIPTLFAYNEVLIISDGLEARMGAISANHERFQPWRTIEGEELAPQSMPQLQVLLNGVFEMERFLSLIRYFIAFDNEGKVTTIKKMAGYHQFHAVRKAIKTTIEATGARGDKRCGVVWHTQGSGKSLTMAFYAGQIIQHPAMENPTIVVITDRNDLDDQLFGTFSRCHELLRQEPIQADSRADLREHLAVASGGVVFTTIQKFFPAENEAQYPLLSDRRNIVVIADEAHRSQYDFIDGFARHMRDALPNASFIGFTGTPIELTDKNTRAVFGDYISIYDIQRAVQDGATVPIYYESRLALLDLDEKEKPRLDPEFEEVTEGEEEVRKEKLKSKWAALEAVVGSGKRLKLIARDLVNHFEERQEAMSGKAMIVCMSRRICVDLYREIIKLRPYWHNDDDTEGEIKIVMTGAASDQLDWQPHIRNKQRREAIANRFRDEKNKLKIVIVRDMWLTGFDVPCLHTMYVDKPMRGHGLMQAIARVNRVFKDKPGGLVVDYIGLADQLKKAMAIYTESGGKGDTAIDQEQAVMVMLEKYEICFGIFHGFDWSKWVTGKPDEKLGLIPPAQEHVLSQVDGKARLIRAVSDLSKAFALSVPHPKAIGIRDDLGFFQAVRAAIAKSGPGEGNPFDELDFAVKQLVSKAIVPDDIVDIFKAAGLKKPDISVLSDEFLAEVKELPHKNLAIELLRKLINGEIQAVTKKNIVQARSFAEMLEKSIMLYKNKAIDTVQVIEQLIELAKDMREANQRGEKLNLSDEELAFYDALETNDSAVKILGDETLRAIAHELMETVRRNVSIDWTIKESARARLRVMVRRILRKFGYPPDKQEKAIQTVMEQAEVLCAEWA